MAVIKPKIYLASKLHHSKIARRIVQENTHDVTWTNRWQWFEGEVEDAKEFAAHFWENDFDDLDAADYVIVYGIGGDTLKGALVEAGYAIAQGKKVVCVGDSDSFSTWQFSQRVTLAPSIETAVDEIYELHRLTR